MTRRFPGVSVCVSILCLSVLSGCTNKPTLEIPEDLTGVFAYGSLISQASMEQSLGHEYERPSYEVHLNGYEREWRCVRRWRSGPRRIDAHLVRGTDNVPILGAAELDLSPKDEGRINGILYLLTGEELESIDQREYGYQRVDVTDEIEEFRIRGARVYVYVSAPSSTPSPAEEEGVCILIRQFLELVTSAGDSRGTAFREEFDRTTRPCEHEIVPFEEIVMENR
jgi:cation transport regulator ChaC